MIIFVLFELVGLVFVITGGSFNAFVDKSFDDNETGLLARADADDNLNGSTEVVSLYFVV